MSELMVVGHTLPALFELLAVGAALGILARVWIARWVLGGLLAFTGRYGTVAMQVVRTPGNLVHELSHAAGYLVAGYTVARVRFWFTDKAGRGMAESGGPWAPWASPFLARLIASPAPIFGGALVLQLCASLLHVPAALISLLGPPWNEQAFAARSVLASDALQQWWATPQGGLEALAFLSLTLCLSIDLAPSWTDLASFSRPLLLILLFLVSLGVLSAHWEGLHRLWEPADLVLSQGLAWIVSPLWWALLALVAAGAALSLVRLVLVGAR